MLTSFAFTFSDLANDFAFISTIPIHFLPNPCGKCSFVKPCNLSNAVLGYFLPHLCLCGRCLSCICPRSAGTQGRHYRGSRTQMYQRVCVDLVCLFHLRKHKFFFPARRNTMVYINVIITLYRIIKLQRCFFFMIKQTFKL